MVEFGSQKTKQEYMMQNSIYVGIEEDDLWELKTSVKELNEFWLDMKYNSIMRFVLSCPHRLKKDGGKKKRNNNKKHSNVKDTRVGNKDNNLKPFPG